MASDIQFLQNLQNMVAHQVANKLASKDEEINNLKKEIPRLNEILTEKTRACNKKDQEIFMLKKMLSSKSQIKIKIGKLGNKGIPKSYKIKTVPAVQEKRCLNRKKKIAKMALPGTKKYNSKIDEALQKFQHIGNQIFQQLEPNGAQDDVRAKALSLGEAIDRSLRQSQTKLRVIRNLQKEGLLVGYPWK